MLEILKDETFKLKMNKGDDIAFRHQKFETNIRADFPTFLNANKVNIEINNQTGCDIDKTSKEVRIQKVEIMFNTTVFLTFRQICLMN